MNVRWWFEDWDEDTEGTLKENGAMNFETLYAGKPPEEDRR